MSHDRYLLDKVANKIWFIENMQIKEYPGTYAEYEEWQSRRVISKQPAPEPKKEERPSAKDEKIKSAPDEKDKHLKKLNQTLHIFDGEGAEKRILFVPPIQSGNP